MGQCDDNRHRIGVNYGVEFDIVENTDHLTIAVTIDRSHATYQLITSNL